MFKTNKKIGLIIQKIQHIHKKEYTGYIFTPIYVFDIDFTPYKEDFI